MTGLEVVNYQEVFGSDRPAGFVIIQDRVLPAWYEQGYPNSLLWGPGEGGTFPTLLEADVALALHSEHHK